MPKLHPLICTASTNHHFSSGDFHLFQLNSPWEYFSQSTSDFYLIKKIKTYYHEKVRTMIQNIKFQIDKIIKF